MTQNEILLETGDFLLLEDGSKVLNETQPIVGNGTMVFAATTAAGTGRERFVGDATQTVQIKQGSVGRERFVGDSTSTSTSKQDGTGRERFVGNGASTSSVTQQSSSGRERFIGNGTSTSSVTQAEGTGTNTFTGTIRGDGSMEFSVTQANGLGTIPIVGGENDDWWHQVREEVRKSQQKIRGRGRMVFAITKAEGQARVLNKPTAVPESTIVSFGTAAPVVLHGREEVIPLSRIEADPVLVARIREAVRGLGSTLAARFKAEGRGRITPPRIRAAGDFTGPGFAASGRGRITPPEVVPVEVELLAYDLAGLRLDELMTDAELFE